MRSSPTSTLLRHRNSVISEFGAGATPADFPDGHRGHLPSMTLMPSHTAPTKPVTITVIMALNK